MDNNRMAEATVYAAAFTAALRLTEDVKIAFRTARIAVEDFRKC